MATKIDFGPGGYATDTEWIRRILFWFTGRQLPDGPTPFNALAERKAEREYQDTVSIPLLQREMERAAAAEQQAEQSPATLPGRPELNLPADTPVAPRPQPEPRRMTPEDLMALFVEPVVPGAPAPVPVHRLAPPVGVPEIYRDPITAQDKRPAHERTEVHPLAPRATPPPIAPSVALQVQAIRAQTPPPRRQDTGFVPPPPAPLAPQPRPFDFADRGEALQYLRQREAAMQGQLEQRVGVQAWGAADGYRMWRETLISDVSRGLPAEDRDLFRQAAKGDTGGVERLRAAEARERAAAVAPGP